MVIHSHFPLHWIQEGCAGGVEDGDSPSLSFALDTGRMVIHLLFFCIGRYWENHIP